MIYRGYRCHSLSIKSKCPSWGLNKRRFLRGCGPRSVYEAQRCEKGGEQPEYADVASHLDDERGDASPGEKRKGQFVRVYKPWRTLVDVVPTAGGTREPGINNPAHLQIEAPMNAGGLHVLPVSLNDSGTGNSLMAQLGTDSE